MNWYIVKDEADDTKYVIVGADGFTPRGVIAAVPTNSGEIVKNCDYITITDTYYSGDVIDNISGQPVYRTYPIFVSGQIVSGSLHNYEYESVPEHIISGEAHTFYTRVAKFDDDKYWAKQPEVVSGQVVQKQMSLIREVGRLRDEFITNGTVTFSGEVYSTSEQTVLNISTQMMMIQNGIASYGNMTGTSGIRTIFYEQSFKDIGALIATSNDNWWQKYADHVIAIKSGEAYNQEYLNYLNGYSTLSNWD